MNIKKDEIDQLNAVITVELSQADYQPNVEEALKKVQRQASMPGFRQGKVPAGMIRKMYGKSVLVDELNKMLNDKLHNYIVENKIDILGNPLPKNDTEIDWDNQKDFSFKYEIGLAPKFDVEVSEKHTFNYDLVKVDDELINKYIKDVKRNYGKPVNPEVSGDNDVLYVDINELNEEGEIKTGGIFKSTSLGMDRIKTVPAYQQLIGLKKEDKIKVHCKELYPTAIDLGIALGIEKEEAENLDCNLLVSIKNIARMEEAELNQELFDKIYGEGKVNGEEEFRSKIAEELGLMFEQDQDRKFFQRVENFLLESSSIELPEDFLKRWLIASNEKPITMEQVDAEFGEYSKAMKWKLIENRIIKDFQLQVSPEEAKEEARRFISSHYAKYGQTPSETELENLTKTVLSKESEVQKIYDNLYFVKMLNLFKEKYKLNKVPVSYNEFFGIKETV